MYSLPLNQIGQYYFLQASHVFTIKSIFVLVVSYVSINFMALVSRLQVYFLIDVSLRI